MNKKSILTEKEIEELLKIVEENNSQKQKESSKYIFIFSIGNCHEGVGIIGTFYGTFFELKELLKTPLLQEKFFKNIVEEGCGWIDIYRNNFNCFEKGDADHSIFINREKAFDNLCSGTKVEISSVVINEIPKNKYKIIKKIKDWLDSYIIEKI